MNELRIFCLGDFQVSLNKKTIETFESQKVRAILAYLASQAGNIFYRDKLAGLFWPDMPNTNARRNLNQAIYNLRSSLNDRENSPPFLLSSRETIQFNWNSHTWVDVFDFDRFIEKVETHEDSPEALCRECVQSLNHVEQIYRGKFLENLQLDYNNGFDEWVATRRENIHHHFLNSLSKLITYYENCGQYDLALVYARRLYEFDPLLEKNIRNMMRLLAYSGQRNSALLLYKDLVEALDRELGVQPEQETRELSRQLSEEHAGQIMLFTRINSLPNLQTPTIGREEEISKVCQLIEKSDCRLLTITGAGGSGKTQVGIEVGWHLLPKFSHGISWVDVNTLQSVDTLSAALAEALSYPLQKQSDVFDQLLHFLKSKEILLIFDGFENLLDGVQLITSILKHAPDCKVLVTSRSRLNLKLEHVYSLSGLSFLATSDNENLYDYSAVRLFLDAALRINPDFQPSQVDLNSIVEICRTVDGMPLGILLSAAWIGVYSPSEIAQEVNDSLNFLNTLWQDLPDRQRSLRASFDYSWRLLSEHERQIVEFLSIFQGRFSRIAAQDISGATAYVIGGLENKSLLQRQEAGYYRMHELVRFFARERLAQNAERRQQAYNSHSSYYLNIIQQWYLQLKSAHRTRTISEIDVEFENIRAAWDWAVSVRNSELIIQVCEGFCTYYDLRVRFREGKSACEQAVEVISDETLDYFLIYIWQLHFQRLLNEIKQAEQGLIYCLNRLQNLKNTSSEQAKIYGFANYELGMVYLNTDRKQARKYLVQSIAIFKKYSEDWELMHALIALSELEQNAGDFKASQTIIEEAEEIAYRVGEPQYIAHVLRRQAYNSLYTGNLIMAAQKMKECIRSSTEAGDPGSLVMVRNDYANMLCFMGDFTSARTEFDQVIPLLDHLGLQNEYLRASMLNNLMQIWTGDYLTPKKTLEQNLLIAKQIGDQRAEASFNWVNGQLLYLEGDTLGAKKKLLDSIEIYSQINQLEELSGTTAMLATVYLLDGDQNQAMMALSNSYRIAMQSQGIQGVSFTLIATALYKLNQKEIEAAVELVSMVRKIPAVDKIKWWQITVFNPVMQAAEQLPEDVRQAAVVRGLEGNIFETLPKMAQDLGFGMA